MSSDHRERGSTNAIFVVVVAVLIGSLTTLFYFAHEKGRLETRRRTIEAKTTAADDYYMEVLIKRRNELAETTGWEEKGRVDQASMAAFIKDEEDKIRREEAPESEKHKAIFEQIVSKTRPFNMEEIILILDLKLELAKQMAASLAKEEERAVASAQAAIDRMDEIVAHKEGYRSQLSRQKQKLDQEIAAKERDFQSARSTRENQLAEIDRKIDQEQEEWRQKKLRLDNDLLKIKGQLEELKRREAVIGADIAPDGVVLVADLANGNVLVDLTERDDHAVLPGTRFRVFQPGPAGERLYRGTIEIKTVGGDHSRAVILGLDDEYNPIVRDNYITNPFYNRRRTIKVALLDVPSQDDFKRRLEAIGAKVEDEPGVGTDFLILGREDIESFEDLEPFRKARELGVPLFYYKDLLPYLGY